MTVDAKTDTSPDTRHFTRAVTELGERQPVVARSAIYNAQGLKIIERGVAIDARLYERLTQHQLSTSLDECLGTDATVTGAMLREEALREARRHATLKALISALPDNGNVLFEEIGLIPLPGPVAFQLTMLRELRPARWSHSLRAAVAAAWLAWRGGGTRHDMRMLSAAGVLLDLGMLQLDPALHRPEVALSLAQRRQLCTHPLLAAMLLERHHVYPREVVRAVLEHHEALDGSGYPRSLGAADISPWGRVLALAELVAAFGDGRRDRPVQRLELALRMNLRRYDAQLTGELLKLLPQSREALPEVPAGNGVDLLMRLEAQLEAWPAVATALKPSTVARRLALERSDTLCRQTLSTLTASGATESQLSLLSAEGRGGAVAAELDLIAREAAWQSRQLTRQLRRRWHGTEAETLPPAMQAWLDEVDALVAPLLGG